MPITESDLSGLRDGNVVTTSGDKIGSIGQIYLDDQTGEPSFVTANTGLFGTSQSFVPLQGASVRDGDIAVNYDKDTVKNAPRIDDDGKLSPEEEDRLYEYYGLGAGASQTTTDRTDDAYATTGGVTTGTTTGADYDRGADGRCTTAVPMVVQTAVPIVPWVTRSATRSPPTPAPTPVPTGARTTTPAPTGPSAMTPPARPPTTP